MPWWQSDDGIEVQLRDLRNFFDQARHAQQNVLYGSSAASRDDWDCAGKRRSNASVVYYRWSNLDDNEPMKATPGLRQWDKVEPGSLGATLLEFACGMKPAATPAAVSTP